MLYIFIGIILGFAIWVPVAWLICRKKNAQTPPTNSDQSRDEVGQLSKMTGELAHEMKNPLSTIKLNLRLVSEDLRETARDAGEARMNRTVRKLDIISKEADRLEQILNGFLRYVDRSDLQLAAVDLNELVDDMVDFFFAQAQSHSITMRRDLDNRPLICKVDQDMLKQVVLNLFINAQQAMTDGGELIVRTRPAGKRAKIQISDTGEGIAPDRLQNIFSPYYSSRSAGTGLGLPIAKKVIERHGGVLDVNSEPGRGTMFTIELPLNK